MNKDENQFTVPFGVQLPEDVLRTIPGNVTSSSGSAQELLNKFYESNPTQYARFQEKYQPDYKSASNDGDGFQMSFILNKRIRNL